MPPGWGAPEKLTNGSATDGQGDGSLGPPRQ